MNNTSELLFDLDDYEVCQQQYQDIDTQISLDLHKFIEEYRAHYNDFD